MNIKGTIGVITGAASGIGAATAKELARRGSTVVLLDKDAVNLEKNAQAILASGGQARWYAIDLTNADAASKTAQDILRDIGDPDIIVNAAGSGRFLYLDESSNEEIVFQMASPYFAAAFVTKAFLPTLLKNNRGYIVNLTSVVDRTVWSGATAYAAARWAMRGFTHALKADLHFTDIKVAWAEFSEIASNYWEHNPGSKERVPKISRLIPTMKPEYVAALIAKGIERNRTHITGHWVYYLYYYLCPSLNRWLVRATGYYDQAHKKK